jgi:hypothetical protein
MTTDHRHLHRDHRHPALGFGFNGHLGFFGRSLSLTPLSLTDLQWMLLVGIVPAYPCRIIGSWQLVSLPRSLFCICFTNATLYYRTTTIILDTIHNTVFILSLTTLATFCQLPSYNEKVRFAMTAGH